MTAAAASLDGARLLARLEELRAIGATPEGGVTRLAFSAVDVEARTLVASWMTDAGLAVSLDAATNLIGTRGAAPWIVTGSHIDTVVNGGALDGAYGVVAGIEVAAALHAAALHEAEADVSYAVVAFANEEGARGAVPFTGSLTLIGDPQRPDGAHGDDDGVLLRTRLADAGGDAGALADAAWPPKAIAAYLELHIEQGPVLDRSGVTIGVVEAIVSRAGMRIVIDGAANHAGTTPMELRHDPLVAAAQVILAVRSLATEGHVLVATTGHIEAYPNVRNVIAGRTILGVDVRDIDPARIEAAIDRLTERCASIAAQTSTTIAVEVHGRATGATCAADLQNVIADAADALHFGHVSLPSGAGHDAQIIARVAPIGMIFVPSIGGVSHAPTEATRPEHLVAGAEVLLESVVRVAAAARLAPADPAGEHAAATERNAQ